MKLQEKSSKTVIIILQVMSTHTQTKILPFRGSAICVQQFDDSLIQQFALNIEIRFGLHRYENQDIHCLKLFILYLKKVLQKIMILKMEFC